MKTKLLRKLRRKASKQITNKGYLAGDEIWFTVADKNGSESKRYYKLKEAREALQQWRRAYILYLLIKLRYKENYAKLY